MAVFRLPTLTEDIGSATLVRWLRQPGEPFLAGERLAELGTEDAILVVTAGVGGVISKLLVSPGQTVASGAPLADFEGAELKSVAPVATENAVNDRTAASTDEVTPVLMPQAGNTMEEGTVIEWRVKEGDRVAVGQILCEIETDKATMEFESPSAGRLARFVANVGEPVAVKELIAVLAESDAAADAYLARGGAGVEATPVVAAAAKVEAMRVSASSRPAETDSTAVILRASPAARKVAAKRGVALGTLGPGSGPGGRILSFDVPMGGGPSNGGAKPASGDAVRRPMSKMRRAIGVNLQRSKQTVPHFYVRVTINADPLMAYYEAQRPPTGCSVNDLVVLAVGRAMREFPAVRSQVDDDHIVEFPHANIGIAVGVDDGLVVPVVLKVDTLPLAELAKETKRVVRAGRKGVLENIGKGNFTISNLGMFGVEEFGAIINPPESGILAVSAVRETVIVKDGAMSPGRVMTMTLSADHRVVDGVLAAKFMGRLKEILEHPTGELA